MRRWLLCYFHFWTSFDCQVDRFAAVNIEKSNCSTWNNLIAITFNYTHLSNRISSAVQIHSFESLRTPVALARYPEHSKTGRRGYLGKSSSVAESPQK